MNENRKVITVQNNHGSLILGLLGILFVGLKLTEVIDWSWWYVTLPFWGIFALLIATALLVGFVGIVVYIYTLIIKTFFSKSKI